MIRKIALTIALLSIFCAAMVAQNIYYQNYAADSFYIYKIDIKTCDQEKIINVKENENDEYNLSGQAILGFDSTFYVLGFKNNLLSIKENSNAINIVIDLPYTIFPANNYSAMAFGPDSMLYLITPNDNQVPSTYYITYNILTGKFTEPVYISGVNDVITFILFYGEQMYIGGQSVYLVDDNNHATKLTAEEIVLFGGASYRISCDSTVFVFAGGKTGYVHPLRTVPLISIYHPVSGEFVPVCNEINLPFGYITVDFDQSGAISCYLDLDLDKDDSTLDVMSSYNKNDFADTTACNGRITRLSDDDIILEGNAEVDSIVITWPESFYFTWNIPVSPHVETIIPTNHKVVVTFNNETPLDSVAWIISQISGQVENLSKTSIIPFDIVPYYRELPYDTATAYIFSPVKEIFAGPDTIVSYCLDGEIEIDQLLDNLGGGMSEWYGDLDQLRTTTEAGEYQIFMVVEDIYCGFDTAEIIVEVEIPMNHKIMGKEYLCPGEVQDLYVDAFNSSSVTWQDGSTSSLLFARGPGLYMTYIEDSLGCISRDTLMVMTEEKSYKIITNGNICEGMELNVEGEDIQEIEWSTGDTTKSIIVHSPINITAYITSKNGCIYVVDFLPERCPLELTFPNVFSPNGDGYNDEICFNTQEISIISLSIFDRWGGEIYSSNDNLEEFCWDGSTADGKAVVSGVYVILIKYIEDNTHNYRVIDVTVVK